MYQATSRLDRTRTLSLEAAMVRVFVSESLLAPALGSVQIHGGHGYMMEYEVERALHDAVGGTLDSGTSEMQRSIIERWLGP